ncbi:hypothetical protein HPB50_002216 [Hyalomma asiaticum]|uniref:Uncharacterized protein n=1 Tax=Hyalomma asiaticum TaxID=266040 RepID=A0ACB7RIP5_HYAAI|nr:hypothetical protein HPB50_002216 [Hyalomma asiaticum]
MAAIEKYVLDNPFRPASSLKEDAPPSPCGFAKGASGQLRGGAGQRVFKRHLPAWDFGCDNCDQGFASQAELTVHCAGHVSCPRDDCGFEASPAVVALHEKLQHDSPFIRRTAAVGTDEDVEEWRRQRRLRYPTLRNIEAKKAAEVERQARREVINESARGRRRQRNKRRQRSRRRASSDNCVPPPPSQPEPSAVREERSLGEDLQDEPPPDQITDSDSDCEHQGSKATEPSACMVSGALASLMACYGSDDDEPPTEQPLPSSAAPPPPTEALPEKAKPADGARAKTTTRKPCWPPRRKLTLLERLLEPEMRHERNVVLQCVHYVVDNDFFGQAGPDEDTSLIPRCTQSPIEVYKTGGRV